MQTLIRREGRPRDMTMMPWKKGRKRIERRIGAVLGLIDWGVRDMAFYGWMEGRTWVEWMIQV
jgi:hypothetical protein